MSLLILLSICLPLLTTSTCDCHVCLSQSDFTEGTYRIRESGKYCLTEDIIFNPLPGDINTPNSKFAWFPRNEALYPACDSLQNGAFALGFFAAISVEADNVDIDLNTFEISQHPHFYIEQRFFSIIEIGNAPFLQGSGPNNFGQYKPVEHIKIYNGKLGLSAHHGIHSNDAKHVIIENIQIKDFEVAGVQFNGFKNVQIKNVEIGPSSIYVKPSGYYSNAKFLSFALIKLARAIAKTGVNPETKTITFSGNRELTLTHIYQNLLDSMDIAFRYFINETTDEDINNNLYDIAIDLFSNPSGFPDGASLYGLVMHSHNVAVLGFGNFKNELDDGEDVLLENVYIHDLIHGLNEIPAAYFDKCDNTQQMTPIKGPFGDVMDLRKMVGIDNKGVIDEGGNGYTQLLYIGNPLSDA
eukprot:343704_1